MIVIKNATWSAKIAEQGAELKSLVNLTTGQEYMWQADPAWWAGTAPVLFPVIGGLKEGAYNFEGKQYKLPSHGFARASLFTATRTEADSAELTLLSTAATRENYPFDFALKVSFVLEGSGLAVRYDVSNTGSQRMYFSIGSHPAFNLPFAGGALENYYVLFEREEQMVRWFFKDGIIPAGKTEDALDNSRILSLSRSSFDAGIMIFKHPASHEFSIVNSRNAKAIRVITDGVPYMGVWTKPGGAPFLCIEPWHGIPDMSDTSGNIAEKEGIMSLEPRGSFSTGYRVEIS
ncbi:MAG: aldose 1-epimerase family protein [Spirochaetia bacterium]